MKKFFSKLFSTLAMMLIVLYVSCVLIKQESKLNSLSGEAKQYNAMLDEANMETENLREKLSKVNTDEYIEKYAREKLGLVMPYETIFVDANI